MTRWLIRLYPANWRGRYGDEFEAILEERPLGPFDVADILLGALDAQLHLRGRGAVINTGKGFSMSLRIGGVAAIIGGALFAMGIVVGNGVVGNVSPIVPGILGITGSLALLVALVGLSAFQARVHPALSWAAVLVAATGAVAVAGGIVGTEILGEGDFFWFFVTGVLGVLVGSTLFSIATYRTSALPRAAALLLGASSVLIPVLSLGLGDLGLGDKALGANAGVVTAMGFALGWFVLGISAVRLDRAAAPARPA